MTDAEHHQQELEHQEWQEIGEAEWLAKLAERGREALEEMNNERD